ncbi:PQQ-binding-like beta-propeller repeat protein [Streptomyces sp. NPDC090106]|uniref:outer membrane protein assembly factor BamB family protein n=1 Tax=Streptomyces sp. NPDC090106 TaxID=3365946 RepID=UPI00382F16CE
MTTESSPGQGAPQDEQGWAFRPRRSADRPQQYRDRPRQWQTDAGWDDGSPAEESPREAPAPRFDVTVPLRIPEPGSDAHRAARETGRRTPPPSPYSGDPAGRESEQHSAATGLLDREPPRHTEPNAARPYADAEGAEPRKKGRAGRIVLALAVLATAGGGAAFLLKQEEAAAVASENLTQAWQIPAAARSDTLIGSWLTDKLLVRAGTRGGLRAYDLSDGGQKWNAKSSLPLAEKGTVPCAMSPTVNAKGVGTVAFGEDGSTCTWLAGIKASTGKVLWSIPLTDTKHPASVATSTYVQGNVATIVSANYLGGVNVRTGTRVWGYKPRGRYCNAYNWGTDGAVLVGDYCLDKKTRFTLSAYDPKTGKILWRKAQKAHSEVTHVLSGSPLIASVHTVHEDGVRVFDEHGGSRVLAVGDDELFSGNTSEADHSARLYGDVLATPASSSDQIVIAGFDTSTGAKLWTVKSAALAVPASDDEDDASDAAVYAVTLSGAPQLISIDRRTGRTTPVVGLPRENGAKNFTAGTVYVTPDGGVLELSALGSEGGVRYYR